jgi:hypothetical protein
MTHRNDFQATAAAVMLQQSVDNMLTLTASSSSVPITARPTRSPLPHHLNGALSDRSFRPAPPSNDGLHPPRDRYAYIRILKSP